MAKALTPERDFFGVVPKKVPLFQRQKSQKSRLSSPRTCPVCRPEVVFPNLPHSDISLRPKFRLRAAKRDDGECFFEGLGKDSHEKSGLEARDFSGRDRHRLFGAAPGAAGMNQAMLNKQSAGQTAATAPATPHDDMPLEFPGPVPKPKAGAETAQADPIANPPAQGDQQFGSEPKPTAVEPPKADRGSKVVQTADTAPSPGENPSGPSTASDPFGDFNDAKHPSPGSNAGKSPTPALPAVTPAGDMKLAKEADQPAGKASPTPPKSPAVGEKTPAVASTQTSAGGPPLLELNAPPGQSEPGESSPPQPAAAPKNDPKHDHKDESQGAPKVVSKDKDANSGPQLFGPSGGPELPTASPPATKTADTNANSTPPAPGVDAGKKNLADGGTADGAWQERCERGRASERELRAGTVSVVGRRAGDKQTRLRHVGSQERSGCTKHAAPRSVPRRSDQGNAVGQAGRTENGRVEDRRRGPEVEGPRTGVDAAITGPKMAELPTPPGSTAVPRPSAEKRPDTKPDVQGDGTVSEQAPLGPQRPQLNIEKIAPQNALIGQPLIYTILVKNVGNSDAHDVVVEDRIPKGTHSQRHDPAGGIVR